MQSDVGSKKRNTSGYVTFLVKTAASEKRKRKIISEYDLHSITAEIIIYHSNNFVVHGNRLQMKILKIELFVSLVIYMTCLGHSLSSMKTDNAQLRKQQIFKKLIASLKAKKNMLHSTSSSSSNTLQKLHVLFSKKYHKKTGRYRRKRNVHVNFGQRLLTSIPTNSMRCRIYCRSGFYLQLLPNGQVYGMCGSVNSTAAFLELQSFGPSLVRIKGLHSRRYLTIDGRGKLKAKRYPRLDESLFKEIQEENAYNSYSSFKYYFDTPYDIFLGIRGTGNVKKTWKTYPGQMATQFLVIKSL
eukprot:gene398-1032_t